MPELTEEVMEKMSANNELFCKLFDLSSRAGGALLILDSIGNDLETLKQFTNENKFFEKGEKELYIKNMVCVTEEVKQAYEGITRIMRDLDEVMNGADIAEA